MSVYRAVELRTEMVRAVNTGVSAYIDAAGRVHAHTDAVDPSVKPRGPQRLLHPVALLEGGDTVYAAAGDWLGYGCAGVTAVLGWVRPRRRRGARRPPSPVPSSL